MTIFQWLAGQFASPEKTTSLTKYQGVPATPPANNHITNIIDTCTYICLFSSLLIEQVQTDLVMANEHSMLTT